MTKAVINIKTDKEVKKNAQKLAEEVGLSLSDVLNASLRNFIRTRELHISAVPRMTPELEKLLEEAERDIKTGKNLSGPFTTHKALMKHLHSL